MGKVDLRDLTVKRDSKKRSINFTFLIIFGIAVILLVVFVPLQLIYYKRSRASSNSSPININAKSDSSTIEVSPD